MVFKFLYHKCMIVGFLVLPISLATSATFDSAISFKKTKIQITNKIIVVELATTPQQQARGLMFREKLADDTGMLFVYSAEKQQNFWMKNTFIPLSIAYFDKDQKIINIEDMAATSSIMQKEVATSSSTKPAMYALEMNKGWFKKNRITTGHRFKFLASYKDLGLDIPGPPKSSSRSKAK